MFRNNIEKQNDHKQCKLKFLRNNRSEDIFRMLSFCDGDSQWHFYGNGRQKCFLKIIEIIGIVKH